MERVEGIEPLSKAHVHSLGMPAMWGTLAAKRKIEGTVSWELLSQHTIKYTT